MSGSNALAAAKRRRGGSLEQKGPLPPGSRPQQNSQLSQQPGAQVNPLQLVMINHQRLNNLQSELPKTIDALGENFNALSSNCDYLHEQVTSLQNDFKLLKSSNSNSALDNNSSKLDKLETDMLVRTQNRFKQGNLIQWI